MSASIATWYRKAKDATDRVWTVEHAFEDLALALECEINTLCYPKAALFGFCVGLVVYNLLAVVKGIQVMAGKSPAPSQP